MLVHEVVNYRGQGVRILSLGPAVLYAAVEGPSDHVHRDGSAIAAATDLGGGLSSGVNDRICPLPPIGGWWLPGARWNEVWGNECVYMFRCLFIRLRLLTLVLHLFLFIYFYFYLSL